MAVDTLKARLMDWIVYANNRDWDKLKTLYSEDSVSSGPYGQPYIGKKAAIEVIETWLKDPDIIVEMVELTEAVFMGDEYGYATGVYNYLKDGKMITQLNDINIWRKENGRWVILKDYYQYTCEEPKQE